MSASQAGTTKTAATGGAIPNIVANANKVLDKPFAGMGATQGMSASHARSGVTQIPPKLSAAVGGGTAQGVIPNFTPNPNAPNLTAEQLAWFDKSGGFDNYFKKQNDRYNNAILLGDSDLLSRLGGDSAKLGYKLTDTRREQADAKAKQEADGLIAKFNAEKEAIQSNFDYGRQNINDTRVLEDVKTDRTLNPFSGQKGYLESQVIRGRQIDDSNANAALQSRLGLIDQQMTGIDQTSLADQYYNDSLNSERNTAMDLAGLTGNIGGQKTLNAKDQEFSQGVTMAQITGYLPDGTPTSSQQQQQLQNEWAVAEQLGVITPSLAKLYGIPAGTPTRAAKEFASQLAISQQNANTSSGNLALSRDRFAYDKEQDKKVGGKNYNYETDPEFADDVQYATTNPQALAELKANASAFIQKYGRDGYDALLKYATPEKSNPLSQLFE